MIRITSLCDNVIFDKKCWTAEGASFLVEIDGIKLLFDLGRSPEVIKHNLYTKGVSIETIDYIVLSHGHKGHIGALTEILTSIKKNTTIIYGAGISNPKFKSSKENPEKLSSVENESIIQHLIGRENTLELEKSTCISTNIVVLADIPLSSNKFTTFSSRYLLKNQTEWQVDMFAEEIALCLTTPNGIIILTGCAHRGVDNIVQHAQTLYPEYPLFGLIGGMHIQDDLDRIKLLVEFIKDKDFSFIAPCHCTGLLGKIEIKSQFPNKYKDFTTGSILEIEI